MNDNRLTRRTDQPTRGFTLIELLVAVAIIALIAGLGVMYARKAYRNAMQRAVAAEIERLTQALEAYRGEFSAYPVCMGAITSSQLSTTSIQFNIYDRGTRFNQHVRARWPRCMAGGTDPYSNIKPLMLSGTAPYNYSYLTPAGTMGRLDLTSMDQAEAMVFWLGGFPTPYVAGKPLASSKLIGFHEDPSDPFRLDQSSMINMVSNRSISRFPFDERRLVDTDGDGWLEYLPNLPAANGTPAPYVYFDAGLYTQLRTVSGQVPFKTYPTIDSTAPSTSTVAGAITKQISQWGLAVPYAQEVVGGSIRWQRPSSFQIVCAGYDGYYGNPNEHEFRVPVIPAGYELEGSGLSDREPVELPEEDNLTNFTIGALRDILAGR